MATELREAKIVVRMDLQETGDQPAGPEQRRSRERRERERKREQERRHPAQGSTSVARTALRDLAHGNLYSALKTGLQALTGVPLVEVLAVGALGGMAAAELNERFGPLMAPIVADQLKTILPEALAEALPKVSLEASKMWVELKAKLSSISQGIEGASQVAAASILTGGVISSEMFTEEYGIQRQMAEIQIELMKTRRRILLAITGEGIAKSLQGALEGMALPGSVGK